MYVIRGKMKNRPEMNPWMISGLDFRPLKFDSYSVAHRECDYYQQQNAVYVRDYGDEEVIYEVIEHKD